MKTIDDLKLSKKSKAVVKTWLEEWLNTFIAQARGREGTVHRADFLADDFFYFTDCTDILHDNPESQGYEDNVKIRKRKQKVMLQLLIKTLLGTVKCKKIKCSHCGFSDRYIGPLSNGTGHFLYCPNCKYTTIATYPDGYKSCIGDIEKYKLKDSFAEPNEKAKEACEKYGVELSTAAITCGACCKDTPIENRLHKNCKYYFKHGKGEPCKSCKDYSNWKSKECTCKN